LSITELNYLVVTYINGSYTKSYYDNKILYDSIILHIYGNLFKAKNFIDNSKIFLEKFDYFKKEQSCWWKSSFSIQENENNNILEEAPLLLNYYNFFLHANELFENPTLQYTLDLVSNILENKIYIGGSGRKISTECRIMLCRYVCNIELILRRNNNKINHHKKKDVKAKKKQAIYYQKKNIKKYIDSSTEIGSLRKTPDAPRRDWILSLRYRNQSSSISTNPGYISTALTEGCWSLQKIPSTNIKLGMVKTILGPVTYNDFDFLEKKIFDSMYGPDYDSFHI